jgi:hypothetical protein
MATLSFTTSTVSFLPNNPFLAAAVIAIGTVVLVVIVNVANQLVCPLLCLSVVDVMNSSFL